MSILDVKRAYNPQVEWIRQAFQQLTIAQIQALNGSKGIYPNLVPVKVNPSLIHRKIWAWFWSTSAAWSADITLVGMLNGVRQFEHMFVRWNTGAQTDKFIFNVWTVTSNVGAIGEQLFTVVNVTNVAVSPFRLNVSVDELFLRVDKITGAAANFDAGLVVQSQQGV